MSSVATDGFDFGIFPVEIRERSGLYYLICKTFNIIESDSSLDQAFSRLLARRRQISSELASFGIDSTHGGVSNNVISHSPILQKWMQISIIFMCLGFPLGLLAGTVIIASKASSIAQVAKNSIKSQVYGLVSNPAQLTVMLNSVATKLDNVTPERREELIDATHRIVAFMKPIMVEIQGLSDSK